MNRQTSALSFTAVLEKYVGSSMDEIRDLFDNLDDALLMAGVIEIATHLFFFRYTATADQTVFQGADASSRILQIPGVTPKRAIVYVNRVKQDEADYAVENDGMRIRFNTGLQPGDLVWVSTFGLNLDNTYFFGDLSSRDFVTTLTPAGTWDATSGSFPASSVFGTYYRVKNSGTVDGAAFVDRDWLIPTQDDASTADFEGHWVRADYSRLLPVNVIQGHFDSKSQMLADTTMQYSGGVFPVASGELIAAGIEDYVYEVAASGAGDHHETTAGGIKLYEAGPYFSTRARLVAANTRNVAASRVTTVGTVWWANGISYQYDGSTTSVPSLTNWKPSGVVRFEHFGAVGDGITDDSAAVTAANTYGAPIDMGGKSFYAPTVTSLSLSVYAFNGTLTTQNASGVDESKRTNVPFFRNDVRKRGTKCRILSWINKRVLWLGTSIPYAGFSDSDGYPEIASGHFGFRLSNKSFGGSHCSFWGAATSSDYATNEYKALSMTESDRLFHVGNGVTGLDGNGIHEPIFETADARIATPWQDGHFDVVVLDHNHNDRRLVRGTLTPETVTITGVAIGATTTLTVSSLGSLVEADGVYLRITGIDKLDYAAARVISAAGSTVVIDYDSTGYVGGFISGTLYKLDRTTLYGSFEFVLAYIKNSSLKYGTGLTDIVMCSAPSEYTGNAADNMIWSNARYLETLAAKWGCSFFDIASDYDIALADHINFFPDEVHPTTVETKKALANHWISWMSGGRANAFPTQSYIPKATDVTTNNPLVYSRTMGGMVTADYMVGAPTELINEDFSAGLGAYTQQGTGTLSTVSAPWGGGESAMQVTVTDADKVANILKSSLTTSNFISTEFDIWLTSVAGVITAPTLVEGFTLLRLRGSGSEMIFAVDIQFRQNITHLKMTSYDQTGNLGFIQHPSSFELKAQTKHRIRVEHQRAKSSTEKGGIVLSIDGVPAIGPVILEDHANVNAQSIQLGSIFSSHTSTLTYWLGNWNLETRPIATPYSGSVTEGGTTFQIANGLIIGVV